MAPAGTDGCVVTWVERPDGRGAADRLLAAVARAEPDVVIALDPEPGEGDVLAASGVPAAAWLVTAPSGGHAGEAHAGFERVLAVSPAVAGRAHVPALWRVEPLPVADALFAAVRDPGSPPRIFFDGPASDARDELLQPVKHGFDVLHLAGGADEARLADLLGRCDAAIDLAEEAGLAPRERIGTALAAGLLVLAEDPAERPGLEPGTHLLTFGGVWDLYDLLTSIRHHPDAYRSIRVRGRRAAEALRASVVLPRLAADLLADAVVAAPT